MATNRWLPPSAYVPWNLAVAAGSVGLAHRVGCRADELGLEPRQLRRGLAFGAAGAALVATGYAALLTTRTSAEVFDDRRVTSLSAATARSHMLVRIPFGTVLTEEVVFRGVVPALLASSRRPTWVPGAVTSLLFGLWHVLPSRDLARANPAVARASAGSGTVRTTVLAVGGTTAAGAALHVLRQRANHLAAPIAVHLAANILGVVTARRHPDGPDER